MVRILTAHRVFPAKVTGGNGIAGTSVVPVLLKEYAHRLGGCNDIRLCIKRWDLDDGVVVGPGLFKTMGEQFDGRRPLAVPYEKAGCRGAESADHPKNIFHCAGPSFAFGIDLPGIATRWLVLLILRPDPATHFAGWMRRSSDALPVCGGGYRRCGGNGYTLGYGFGSIRSCAWDWSAFSCEDGGVGSGCSDSSQSLRGGKGEAEC
jgi:hypothetical protein